MKRYYLAVPFALMISTNIVLADCCSTVEFEVIDIGHEMLDQVCHVQFGAVGQTSIGKVGELDIYRISDDLYMLVHASLGCIGPIETSEPISASNSFFENRNEWVTQIYLEGAIERISIAVSSTLFLVSKEKME